jgi:PadR family transcriptional regulator
MPSTPSLGEFEHLVILAIMRLDQGAYGVSIRGEIAKRTGREVTPGALYTTLDRLEEKRFLTSRLGDPTPERGGRSKRFYRVTSQGVAAVRRAQSAFSSLLEGIPLFGGSGA